MTPREASAGDGRSLRALRATLVAGALYDFAFAALMLLAPRVLASVFALPLPGEPFYLRLIAVLLSILGATYLYTARDPAAVPGLVGLAVAGRLAGFAVLAASAAGRPELSGLWGAALGDLAFAVAHAVTGRRLVR